MYDFILQSAFLAAVGAIVYIISRAVPRVNEIEGESKNVFDRWLASLPLEKADVIISVSVEKILRRLKVVFMRLDNALNRHIGKMKERIPSGFSGVSFKKMAESPDEEIKDKLGDGQSDRGNGAPGQ